MDPIDASTHIAEGLTPESLRTWWGLEESERGAWGRRACEAVKSNQGEQFGVDHIVAVLNRILAPVFLIVSEEGDMESDRARIARLEMQRAELLIALHLSIRLLNTENVYSDKYPDSFRIFSAAIAKARKCGS